MNILIDNHWADRDRARIDLFSDAVMFGCGVFETLRTYPGRRLFRIADHISRLLTSADHVGLNIHYSAREIRNMVERVTESSQSELQRLKILALPEHLIVTSTPLIQNEALTDGVSLKSIQLQRALPEIKSTSYLDCLLAYRTAVEAGCDDALLIDDKGHISEGSRCNLFWIKDDTIMTREKGVLPGVTRKVVIEEMAQPIRYRLINLPDLIRADELFITNSIIGVVPVTEVDGNPIKDGNPGPLTQSISNHYNRLASSGNYR